MSKVLEATCSGGVVTVEGRSIGATVLSEGVLQSEGIAILEKDESFYLTSSASDVKTLIQNIGSTLDQVITVLTTLDGVSTSPGSAAAAITALTTLKNTLVAQKDNLK